MNAALEEFFAQLEAYVQGTRTLMQAGREAELEALNAVAAQLSETAAHLPLDKDPALAQRFEQAFAGLNALLADLTARREEVRAELGGLGQARKASVAYRVTNTTGVIPED